MREIIVERLADRLDLSAEQQTEVKAIVTKVQIAFMKKRAEDQPILDKILDVAASEMKQKLSPEQQQKLDELYRSLRQRIRRHEEQLKALEVR